MADTSNDPKDAQTTTLADGRFLRMVKQGRWEYCERHTSRGAVAVVAVTDEREMILVEQHRVPLGRACIELPAGLVGDDAGHEDEALAHAAERELLEETGYLASSLSPLMQVATSPGLTSETIHLFRATGLTRKHDGGGVDHEEITVHLIPVAEAMNWLNAQAKAGKAVDAKTWIGVLLVQAQ